MAFQKIKKEDRFEFIMKATYEGWAYHYHTVITDLWRIEDEIEKLSNSLTKDELNHILYNLQNNINKSIWHGCPIGRINKVEDESPYSTIIRSSADITCVEHDVSTPAAY